VAIVRVSLYVALCYSSQANIYVTIVVLEHLICGVIKQTEAKVIKKVSLESRFENF